MTRCDLCGKDMVAPFGGPYLAFQCRIKPRDGCSPESLAEMEAYLQKQLGPYQLGRAYNACWECMLRALGFKPPEPPPTPEPSEGEPSERGPF